MIDSLESIIVDLDASIIVDLDASVGLDWGRVHFGLQLFTVQ